MRLKTLEETKDTRRAKETRREYIDQKRLKRRWDYYRNQKRVGEIIYETEKTKETSRE